MAKTTGQSPLTVAFYDQVMEKLRNDTSALSEFTNLDHLVANNSINMAEAGADPTVNKNNSALPLTAGQRTDTSAVITLDTYDTTPTVVTNVEELETNYNKAQSVLAQHTGALMDKVITDALYNIAPSTNSDDHPVIGTTGTSGKMTYADILKMRLKFNKMNLPQDGRVMVLSPEHEADLLLEDADRYNQIMTTGYCAGFKVYTSNALPTYTSGAKDAQDASSKGELASVFFHKNEVMRCMGDVRCEAEERWSDYRGYMIGAQVRFCAAAIRDKGVGVIYTAA